MNYQLWISSIAVITTSVAVIALSVPRLKLKNGISLVAVYGLGFVNCFGVAPLFLQSIISRSEIGGDIFKPDTAVRFFIGITIVNCVILVFLKLQKLGALRRSRPPAPHPPSAHQINLFGFYTCLLITFIGLVTFMRSPLGSFAFGLNFDEIANYGNYYRARLEYSQLDVSLWERHATVLATEVCLPIATLVALRAAVFFRLPRWWGVWAVLFFVWLGTSILLLKKAPIVVALLTNCFGYLIFSPSRNLRTWKNAIKIVAIICVLFLVVNYVYTLLGATTTPLESVVTLIERIYDIPISTAYYHYEVFPSMHQHTNYSGSRILNLLLTAGAPRIDYHMTYWEIAALAITGFRFNMNTSFVAGGWAEFGYIGVIEQAVILFGMLHFLERFLRRREAYQTHLLIVAYIGGRAVATATNNDLMTILIAGGFIAAPIFACLIDGVFFPARKKAIRN